MKTELNVYIVAIGVKHRGRSTKREIIKLGTYPLDTCHKMLQELAEISLSKTMRTVARAVLHLDFVEIEQCDGYEMMNALLFDPRNTKIIMRDSRENL